MLLLLLLPQWMVGTSAPINHLVSCIRIIIIIIIIIIRTGDDWTVSLLPLRCRRNYCLLQQHQQYYQACQFGRYDEHSAFRRQKQQHYLPSSQQQKRQ